MGDGGNVGLNVNGAVTVFNDAVTLSNPFPGFQTASVVNLGASGQQDGLGNYSFVIDTFDGFAHASRTVSFQLVKTTGSWSSADDVLTANNKGYVAAVHVMVCGSPCNQANDALAT